MLFRSIPAGSKPTTSCAGTGAVFSSTTASVTLANAIVSAGGSCSITIPVQAPTAGTYAATIAANALSTGPAGGNTASAAASLTVGAPGGGGGGGQISWLDLLLGASALLLVRRRLAQSRA